MCPGGSNAVPSDAERFLPCPFGFPDIARTGLNFKLEGESNKESVSCGGDGPCALCSSQYFSSISVFFVSMINSLPSNQLHDLPNCFGLSTWPSPLIAQHVSSFCPICHNSEVP